VIDAGTSARDLPFSRSFASVDQVPAVRRCTLTNFPENRCGSTETCIRPLPRVAKETAGRTPTSSVRLARPSVRAS